MNIFGQDDDILQMKKASKIYQVPNWIRTRRASFVAAYTHIDTFALSRKKEDTATSGNTVLRNDDDDGSGRCLSSSVHGEGKIGGIDDTQQYMQRPFNLSSAP